MSFIYRVFAFAIFSLGFVLAVPNVSAQTPDRTQDIHGIDTARNNYAAALEAKGKIPLDHVWLEWRTDAPQVQKVITHDQYKIVAIITNCTSPVFSLDDQATQECDDKTSYMGPDDRDPKFRCTFIFSKVKDGRWVLKSRKVLKKY